MVYYLKKEKDLYHAAITLIKLKEKNVPSILMGKRED